MPSLMAIRRATKIMYPISDWSSSPRSFNDSTCRFGTTRRWDGPIGCASRKTVTCWSRYKMLAVAWLAMIRQKTQPSALIDPSHACAVSGLWKRPVVSGTDLVVVSKLIRLLLLGIHRGRIADLANFVDVAARVGIPVTG